MSTLFAAGDPFSRKRDRTVGCHPQSNSWLAPLNWLLACSETTHQRTALRQIAHDPHLMRDLGLMQDEALELANRPFWR
jgi:uncharacterized protein YjiS (DUF1127 family)